MSDQNYTETVGCVPNVGSPVQEYDALRSRATSAEARAKRMEEALRPLLFVARRWMWDDDDRCVGCRCDRDDEHEAGCYANEVVRQARKAMEAKP